MSTGTDDEVLVTLDSLRAMLRPISHRAPMVIEPAIGMIDEAIERLIAHDTARA